MKKQSTRLRAAALSVLLMALDVRAIQALPRYGPLEIAGNVSAQQLFRHSDIDEWAFVQQRNTIKLRLDYQMLEDGKLIQLFPAPFLSDLRALLLYRGVYDSVYDYTPGFRQKDIWGNTAAFLDSAGRRTPVTLEDIHPNAQTKFENVLREAYIDLNLAQLPLSFRLGRQQIIWGETDNFRLLDRVNALDLTWHLQQESWDELRIPYWMIKGLWDIGRLGPLSNAFAEFYWNPGDWYPAKKQFLPHPWSAPIVNPIDLLGTLLNGRDKLANDTKLSQGDYHRNPGDNSQIGVRFNSVTPQGLQFTLNYFYQRWAGGDDGTNSSSIRGLLDPTQANAALARGELPIEAVYPYVHAAGISLNYADDEYTLTVFRAETVYEFGVPFADTSKQFQDPVLFALLGKDVFGIGKHDMWKGMIAFDRPTWIRPLNRRSTFLILGQFFWHYLVDNPSIRCNDPAEGAPCALSGQGGGLRGIFSSGGFASAGKPFIDRVRTWELLATLAATTFYKGGKFVPFLVYVIDPVNKYNQEVIWFFDYFITNNLIFHMSQRFFINTTSDPVFETWGVAGTNRGRSETGVRLTYQF